MARNKLDLETLVVALDAARKEKELSWRQVALEAEISASTLTRMQRGRRPDVDTFAALVSWLGVSADEFLTAPAGGRRAPRSASVATLLRARKEMSAGAADALVDLLHAAERFRREVAPKRRRR